MFFGLNRFKRAHLFLVVVPLFGVITLSLICKTCSNFLYQFIIQNICRKAIKMWKCRKCGKAVYFAERKSSLGFDWHPECLRCEECGKRLNPGQHADHKGVPYCYIPCYGALFGPQLYGHGSRVESHSSFGKAKMSGDIEHRPHQVDKSLLEFKLKQYNQFFNEKFPANVVKSRERNGKLILEGSLRLYWDVSNKIHLKEDIDNRILVIRRKSSYATKRNRKQNRRAKSESKDNHILSSSSDSSPANDEINSTDDLGRCFKTLPHQKMRDVVSESAMKSKSFDDEYIDLQNNRDTDQSAHENDEIENEHGEDQIDDSETHQYLHSLPVNDAIVDSGVTLRRTCKLRRSKARLRRRCSINGHYYNRETSIFTPDSGSVTSVWVTSLVNTTEVINLLLDKFKVTNRAEDFSLFVIRDNGECRRVMENEYPLVMRVLLGPDEDATKVYIFNKNKVEISSEVAQYLNLSNVELQMFLKKFEEEELKELKRIKKKFHDVKNYIRYRIEELENHGCPNNKPTDLSSSD